MGVVGDQHRRQRHDQKQQHDADHAGTELRVAFEALDVPGQFASLV